jgi:hypothetical protein
VIFVNKGLIGWAGQKSSRKGFRNRKGKELIVEDFLDGKSMPWVLL